MTAHEPPNPYTPPTAALAHEAAQEAEPTQPRKPSRLAAVIVALLSYPAAGGFYFLGLQRRFIGWTAAGLVTWALLIVGAHVPVPKLAVAGFVGMVGLLFVVLAATIVAKPSGAPAKRAVLTAVLLIVGARVAGVAIKEWVVEAFQIPAASMMPTLLIGDHILIKKSGGSVARGDIIVFKFPADHSTDYVKRVVAVGGDTIEVRDGVPAINGVPLPHEPIAGPCSYRDDGGRVGGPEPEPEPCTLVRETNAGRSYTIMLTSDHPALDSRLTRIPDGEVFVMGDNRDNSYDSRKWGTVSADLVKGKATVTWWSRDKAFGIRWSRVGRRIE